MSNWYQKQLEQVPTRGHRISILGVWQPDNTFEYALAQGGFDSESYINVMTGLPKRQPYRWQQPDA